MIQNLTPTEERVLHKAIQGKCIKETASEFHRSIDTVKTHSKNIKAKLNASSMTQAVARYLKNHPQPKKLLNTLLAFLLCFSFAYTYSNVKYRRLRRRRAAISYGVHFSKPILITA